MSVQMLTVTEDEGEQRLDKWLRRRFPQLNQVAVEKLCRTGQIRVDSGRVKASDRVLPGQTVRVPPLPDAAPRTEARVQGVSAADARMIQAAVLWKDEHMIVLNKPAGLPSQGGSGQGDRHVDGLAEALKFGYKEKPKLVHRLDKDTSGVLMLARTDRVARALSEALRHRAARKIYWAVVAGVPHPKQGSIKFALEKAPGRGRGGEGEKMLCVHPAKMADHPDAKRAHTDYFTLWFLGTRLSWMALEPVTGRTHQLRAHMAHIGHAIIGDPKYFNKENWELPGGIQKRLHLLARRIVIPHPRGGYIDASAPLPPHMLQSWNLLGLEADRFDPIENAPEE